MSDRALSLSVEITAIGFLVAFLALVEVNHIVEWIRRWRR